MSASAVAAVGVGAAVGAWLRWALGSLLNPVLPTLPLGTLATRTIAKEGLKWAVSKHISKLAEDIFHIHTAALVATATVTTYTGMSIAIILGFFICIT